MDLYKLKGKIALITGASRGIGEAVAVNLARAGVFCILVSRKIEALEKVVGDIRHAGGQAEAIPCHLGKMDDISRLMNEIRIKHNRLDILINNAAANPYFGKTVDADESVWDKINDVNLKGPFFLTQEAAKMMMENESGSIINVASVEGVKPDSNLGIYSIAKAGVICMTKAFAKELGPKNIRVNALLPGLTKTKFASALFTDEALHKQILKEIPMGRHAEPEEMAGAVMFLASAASSYMTGACLTCDGGYLA